MRRKAIKLTLLSAVTIILSACGGSDIETPEDASNSLIGSWDYTKTNNGATTECVIGGEYGGNNNGRKINLTFDNSVMTWTSKSYNNKDCNENGLDRYIIEKWDYTVTDTPKDKNGGSYTKLKIVNTGTTVKKGTVYKLHTGEERGLAIKFLDKGRISILDGDADSLNSVDVNKLKFETNPYFQKR